MKTNTAANNTSLSQVAVVENTNNQRDSQKRSCDNIQRIPRSYAKGKHQWGDQVVDKQHARWSSSSE